MKLFCDSANLDEIEEAFSRGFISGITTNPSILAKEPKCDFKEHVKRIIELCNKYDRPVPLSVEVFSTDPKEMIRQAQEFSDEFKYDELYVKVPVGWEELKVISELRQRRIKVNCTCCMSFNQAIMASSAGANYVSLFFGRIRDTGYDAFSVVEQTCATFKKWERPTEVIVGSIRHIVDINDAIRAGADIVTVPPQFFPKMVKHPKTDEAVNQFVTDFEKWLS